MIEKKSQNRICSIARSQLPPTDPVTRITKKRGGSLAHAMADNRSRECPSDQELERLARSALADALRHRDPDVRLAAARVVLGLEPEPAEVDPE